jgi:hypothetical protein
LKLLDLPVQTLKNDGRDGKWQYVAGDGGFENSEAVFVAAMLLVVLVLVVLVHNDAVDTVQMDVAVEVDTC